MARKAPGIFALKGEVLACKGCDKALFRFVRDVQEGELTDPGQVEAIAPQPEPVLGPAGKCAHCGRIIDLADARVRRE